mgnify:CR=1 FL=1
MNKYRSHNCSELTEKDSGKTVYLSGWLHRKRDHGNLLFIDLRDHFGLTQCVIENNSKFFSILEKLRPESVLTITGKVVKRDKGTENLELPTGKIEVNIQSVKILSESKDLPMPVFGEQDYPEDIRLKYRFLDLRREEMHKNIILRSKVISFIRSEMLKLGFLEYQTPILTSSSPEGARDFLVPSRLNPGKFYALPQAPQQFKQLIMVSGFDKYFQIAPCFRDEDARADRSPGEFYQLDIEMSFVTQDEIFSVLESLLVELFEKFSSNSCSAAPFPRIPYKEAMLKYGTDKPDLRNPIEIVDVTSVFNMSSVNFNAFKNIVNKGGVVRAIKAPKVSGKPRSFFDKLNNWAQEEGQPGLGYIFYDKEDDEFIGKGPISKFVPKDAHMKLCDLTDIESGDAIFFVCNQEKEANLFAGKVRNRVAAELNLYEVNTFKFCWTTDFPMYEYDEVSNKIQFSHNPFSMPQGGMKSLQSLDPLDVLAYQYDIICNGIELSSGAIRNHRLDIMLKAFEIAGYNEQDLKTKFSALYNAFRFGAPPHGGIAPGIDRIVMLLANEPNIREVIMFPMNQQAEDLLMSAPSNISENQLKELCIKIIEQKD